MKGNLLHIKNRGLTASQAVMVLATLTAIGALVVDYGFQVSARQLIAVRATQAAAVGCFALLALLRLFRAPQPRLYLRQFWYEFATIAALLLVMALVPFTSSAAQPFYYRMTLQLGLFFFLVIRSTELLRIVSLSRLRPAQLFVGSFVGLILMGTLLLMLPAATGTIIEARGTDGLARQFSGHVLSHDESGLWLATGTGDRFFLNENLVSSPHKAPRAPWNVALFTSTSAICVTGLAVVSTGSYWSVFGQAVILGLIQLGGLGIMTFGAVFAVLFWQSLNFRQSAVMQEVVSPNLSVRIGRVLVFVLLSSLVIEALGAWSLWQLWDEPRLTPGRQLFFSVFHGVSAFCNAGFGLYDDSLVRFRNTWQASVSFPLLIILGGAGFTVIYNFGRIGKCHLGRLWTRLRGRRPLPELDRRRLTLQTKLVLATSLVLLTGGALAIFAFESVPNLLPAGHEIPASAAAAATGQEAPSSAATAAPSTAGPDAPLPFMARAPVQFRLAYAWFVSVSARTAGFNTVPMEELTDSTRFLTVVLMFIGASPGSTGGGIKTVTLAIVIAGVWSLLRNRPTAQAYRRRIPQETLLRSLVLVLMSAALVVLATMLLSVMHGEIPFLDCLFEVTSAFGTVGLSVGATPNLHIWGQLLIVVVMFVGRVGPLTLFIALPAGGRQAEYEYPAETVMIG